MRKKNSLQVLIRGKKEKSVFLHEHVMNWNELIDFSFFPRNYVSGLLYLDYITLNFFEMTWDFLVVICSKNTVQHKNLHFLDNYFNFYNLFRVVWDKIWWIIHWKLYNYAAISTCICFLGHKGMRNGTKKENNLMWLLRVTFCPHYM
jgi:hypothetical protein